MTSMPYNYHAPHFCTSSGDQSQVLAPARQALYWLRHFPSFRNPQFNMPWFVLMEYRPTRLRLRIFKWSAGSERGWNGDWVLTRFCIYLVRLARGSCKAFNEDGLGFVPVPFYWEETASLSAAWGEGEGYGYHTCILVAFLHLSLKHQEMLSLCPWPVPVLPSGHGLNLYTAIYQVLYS